MSPKGPEKTTVSCPCGASMDVELRESAEELACPECGQMLEVMVTVDPKTQVKRVGILVKAAAVAPRRRKPKLSTAGGKVLAAAVEEVHVAKCTCGAQLTILPRDPDQIFPCSSCGAEFTASLKGGKGGAAPLLVLRPVTVTPVTKVREKVSEPPKPKTTRVPKVAPPPARQPVPVAAPSTQTAAKEKMLLMTKGDLGAQEILADDEGKKVACYCGEMLPLRGEFHQKILKCESCGSAFRLFAATHPKSGEEMVIMVPRDSGR